MPLKRNDPPSGFRGPHCSALGLHQGPEAALLFRVTARAFNLVLRLRRQVGHRPAVLGQQAPRPRSPHGAVPPALHDQSLT